MHLIPPQLLMTYIAVCETGSFTKAAERVHSSQSTISQQINRIESIMGATLLVRTPQRTKTTEEGEFVLRYAHRILDLNSEMLDGISRNLEQQTIRIGVPDDLAVDVTRKIGKTQQHYNVSIEFTSGLSNSLYQEYQAGVYDIILVKQAILGNAYAYRKEPLIWLDSIEHPTFRQKVTPLVLFPPGALYRGHILDSLEQLGHTYKINYCSSNLSAIITASSVGFGITLLPEKCKTHEHQIIEELQIHAPADDFYLAIYINEPHNMVINKIASELINIFDLKLHHNQIKSIK